MNNHSDRHRICFFCADPNLGPAEQNTLELIRGLSGSGEFEPWVLLPSHEGSFAEALREAGIRTEHLGMPPRFFSQVREQPFTVLVHLSRSFPGLGMYFMRLVQLLRRNQTRLIHTTGVKCHWMAALLLPLHRVPVVWHVRAVLGRGPALTRLQTLLRAARAAFPELISVVFNSQAAAAPFGELKRSRVIYEGIDAKRCSTAKSRLLRERFRIRDEARIVGLVGADSSSEMRSEFVQMAARLAQDGLVAHFVLPSERADETELTEMARAAGASDQIHFMEPVPDSLETLSSLDVMVYATARGEPFGRSVLEAMACGVPVVAAATGSVLELISDGHNGLLFAPGDVAQMVRKTGQLLTEPEFGESLAARARKDFEEGFTIAAQVRQMSDLYRTML